MRSVISFHQVVFCEVEVMCGLLCAFGVIPCYSIKMMAHPRDKCGRRCVGVVPGVWGGERSVEECVVAKKRW